MLVGKREIGIDLSRAASFVPAFLAGAVLGLGLRAADAGLPFLLFLFSLGLFYVRLLFFYALPSAALYLAQSAVRLFKALQEGFSPFKALVFLLAADAGAVACGLIGAAIFRPGGAGGIEAGFSGGFAAFLPSVLPFFFLASFIFGAGAYLAKEAGEKTCGILSSLEAASERAEKIMFSAMPFFVFCLAAGVFSLEGAAAFLPLIKTVFLAIFASVIYALLVWGSFLRRCGRFCAGHFWSFYRQTVFKAASGLDSRACMDNGVHNLARMGIAREKSAPLLDLLSRFPGCGSALYLSAMALTALQLCGLVPSVLQLVALFAVSCFMSLALRSKPSGSLLVLFALLQLLGLPAESAVYFILADVLLDLAQSAVNAAGSGALAYLADKLGWK